MPETALNNQPSTLLLDAVTAATDSLERDEPPAVEELADILVDSLVRSLPVAHSASIVRVRPRNRFEAVATTSSVATELDTEQARTKQGPVLAALRTGELVTAGDLATDPRWPALAQAVAEGSALRAAICIPVNTSTFHGSLNVYSETSNAFTAQMAAVAQASAATSRLVVLAAAHRNKVANLVIALETNRRIGAAVGILIASQRCSYDDAVALLVSLSQQSHRKIGDLAEEILLTGALPQH